MDNKKILIIILVVVAACLICVCLGIGAYFLFFQGDEKPFTTGQTDYDATSTALADQAIEVSPIPEDIVLTPTPEEPSTPPEQQKWLVMLYQDGDDHVLEYDIYFDANEAEVVGSNDRVTVVTQLDRFWGAFDGDGDWSTAKRFFLTANDDLDHIYSQEIVDLGEVNMADVATLVDFGVWAISTYPADRFVLVMSDHGAGWHGGWSDEDNNDQGLMMRQIDEALGEIINRTGIKKFDIVVFDACLMAQLESFTAIAPHARIAVASEETIPSIGLAYAGFLSDLLQNPAMSPTDLARSMVDTYIDEDQRIVNDNARETFVSEVFNYTGMTTSEEVAVEIGVDITITAVNLEKIPQVNAAFNGLAYEMTFVDQTAVARARTYAQAYYNLYGPEFPPSILDLGNFVSLLEAETNSTAFSTAASRLYGALDEAVIAERHGPERPGSTGIAFYFPNSALYQTEVAGYSAYTAAVDRFVEASQWDDFLAFHYAGTPFEQDSTGPVIPAPGAQLHAPGLGDIDMGSLLTSSEVVSPGESVHLETELSGENIGYIYFFAGKHFEETNTFLAIDADFVLSETTKESNGVYYPDWGDGSVTVSIDWMPYIYFINDGVKSEFAVLYPLHYGATSDQNVYAVDGLYTFGDGGEQTYAVMTFRPDGWMIEVYSFDPEAAQGPREILPRAGDSFTLLLKAIAMPEDGNGEPEFVEFPGGTLTFGTSNFFWDYYEAEPGQYVAGVGALDLDGNYTLDFVPVVIE